MNDQVISKQSSKLSMRRRQVILFVGLIVVIFCMWFWHFLHNPEQFPITKVKVYGEYQHASKQKIKEIVSPLITKGLFSVNIKKIKTDLNSLPWIAHTEVDRVWPDQLTITLTEKQAAALWNKNAVLSEKAIIFYPSQNSIPSDLPTFEGLKGQEKQMLATYHQISEIISPLGLHINDLRLTSDMLWQMRLNNGMNVMIGSKNVLARTQRFVQVYNKIFDDRRHAQTVDLRYPKGIAVKWVA